MTLVIAVDGIGIATHTLGDDTRPPALLIPGGPCRDVEYLGDFAGVGTDKPLAVVHPRGTHSTGGLSNGWWNDADDVIAVADSLGMDTFDLIAHSAGTRLALSVSTRFPERVRSRILVTPSAAWLTGASHDGPSLAGLRTDMAVQLAMASMQGPAPTNEAEFQRARNLQSPAGYAAWTQTQQDHSLVGRTSLAATTAWFGNIPADAPDRILAAPKIRTLVIGGSQDMLSGVQPVRELARALDAKLVLLDDCGHYPWVERPGPFREAVTQGFASTRLPPAR